MLTKKIKARSHLLLWMAAIGSALPPASVANAETSVILNSWHNLNYAKSVCDAVNQLGATHENNGARARCASVSDVRFLGRRLELDVESKFASNPRCEGVSIVRGWYEGYDEGDGREFLAAQTREHWELLLDFEPSSDEHHWSLFHFEGFEILKDNVDGEGTPAQIADAVCIVVTHRGATIH